MQILILRTNPKPSNLKKRWWWWWWWWSYAQSCPMELLSSRNTWSTRLDFSEGVFKLVAEWIQKTNMCKSHWNDSLVSQGKNPSHQPNIWTNQEWVRRFRDFIAPCRWSAFQCSPSQIHCFHQSKSHERPNFHIYVQTYLILPLGSTPKKHPQKNDNKTPREKRQVWTRNSVKSNSPNFIMVSVRCLAFNSICW